MKITPSTPIPSRFRAMSDPDMARDLLIDYLADDEAQYGDYVEDCADLGIRPVPFEEWK